MSLPPSGVQARDGGRPREEPLRGVHGVALIVRFVAELALLAGAGVLGRRLAPGGWAWLLAVALPALVVLVWGLLLAEKPKVVAPAALRLVLETLLFAGVGAGLVAVGLPVPAIIGFALWLADRIVLAVTRR